MFSFLRRDLPASGRVLYPGSIPPPLEQLSGLREPVTCKRTTPSGDQVWAVAVTHPVRGEAEIACLRQLMPLPPELIAHTLTLSDDEKARARIGEAVVAVRIRAQHQNVLRDRKRLLFWLRALMQADGAVAIDDASMLYWSQAMLDDELAHDADLDIESLYTIHAVQDSQDAARVVGCTRTVSRNCGHSTSTCSSRHLCSWPTAAIRSAPWRLVLSRVQWLMTSIAFRWRFRMARSGSCQ